MKRLLTLAGMMLFITLTLVCEAKTLHIYKAGTNELVYTKDDGPCIFDKEKNCLFYLEFVDNGNHDQYILVHDRTIGGEVLYTYEHITGEVCEGNVLTSKIHTRHYTIVPNKILFSIHKNVDGTKEIWTQRGQHTKQSVTEHVYDIR